MRSNNKQSRRLFFDRLKNFVLIVISLAFIFSLIRNISRIKRSEDRIDEARERVNNLEARKKELEENLNDSNSELYLETQLRDGLGLAKEDEIVMVLPDDEVLRRIAPDIEEKREKDNDIPNWKKWLSLFIEVED